MNLNIIGKRLSINNGKILSRKWLIGILVSLAAVGLFLYSSWSQEQQKGIVAVKTVPVRIQDLSFNILTTGTLEAVKEQDFYAKAATTVKEIKKEAGEKVSVGEPILLLDNTQALIDLGQAESNLALKQAELRQAASDKKLWDSKLEDAKKNLQRSQMLYEAGAASLQEVETAELQVADAENRSISVDLKSLVTQVNKGDITVQAARETLKATVITSPFNGTILKLGVKESQPVSSGTFLLSVGDLNNLEAISSINEYDALKLKMGQQAQIYSEGMREKTYAGHISQIAPVAEMEQTSMGTENKVGIRVALDEKVEELKPGFSINIKILIDKRENALIIPLEAITKRNDKDVVLVYSDGVAELREIEKGLANELYQEVLAGLSQGDRVITTSLDKLNDGTKVKVDDND